MAYQVPMDLIEHARILLREEAGVGSYNPGDPSFPSLPSVEAAISGFDPSPDYPRCKHCNGKLLKGSQSLICVYCGRAQNQELPPEPISFKSTIGFRWLVDSLGVDGSEFIEPSDDKQNNRGRNSVKDEISLSDFLGLEMKWPVESERFGLTDADVLKDDGKGPFLLAGVDFLQSLSEQKAENSSSLPIEQAISNEKSIEFDTKGSRSIKFSENRDLSGGVVKPIEVINGDNLSAWEADFQAASSVDPIPHDDFESYQPSKIPSANYESHMDSVFGSLKHFEEGSSVDDSTSHAPHTIKENEIDNRSNSFFGVSALESKHGVDIVPEHGEQVLEPSSQSEQEQHLGSLDSVDKVKGVGYDSFDIRNDQWVTSSSVVSSSAKISGNDDSSDMWSGFTGFTGSEDNKHQITSTDMPKEDVSFDAWSDFASSSIVSDGQLATRGLNSADMSVSVSNDSFGPWNDVMHLKCSEDGQQEMSGKTAASTETANQKDEGSFSLSGLDVKLPNMGTLSSADNINEKDESSFNLWDDFMGSTVAQHNPGDSSSVELAGGQLNDYVDDTADGWGNFMSITSSRSEKETNSTETHGDMKINKKDDLFDSLNDFTSSACRPESKSLNEDMTWSDISNPNIRQKIVDQQAPDGKAIVEDDDLLDSRSGFRSSSNAASKKLPSPTDTCISNVTSEQFSNQSWNDFSSSSFLPGQDHSGRMKVSENDTVKDDDLFHSWDGFRSSSALQSNQWQNSEARMPEVDGFFNDWSSRLTVSKGTSNDQRKVGADLVPAITNSSENDDSFDAWSNFTSSKTVRSDQSQNLGKSQVDDKQDVKKDDPFDAWSLLVTSPSQSINLNATSSEHANETSLLNSTGNPKIPGFDSTLQPVLFPDSSIDRNGSTSVGSSPSESLDLFRMKDCSSKSSTDAEQSRRDEHVSVQIKKPIDAETLISQMHDLSFMLESNLSLPKKVD